MNRDTTKEHLGIDSVHRKSYAQSEKKVSNIFISQSSARSTILGDTKDKRVTRRLHVADRRQLEAYASHHS